MCVVCGGSVADGDLAARCLEVDADPEQIAMLATRVTEFDDDTARYDASKNCSSSSARSRMPAATASEISICGNVIWRGSCIECFPCGTAYKRGIEGRPGG